MDQPKNRAGGLLRRIDFNAPVILGMALISFILLLLSTLVGDRIARMFAAYNSGFLDIWMYPRLLTHVLVHQNLAHYAGNFMMILAIGPMVEERYGSKRLLGMIAVTAFVTGLFHVLFSHNTMLMGASGIAFMLIILASFANLREGKLPLTVILVAVLYIGNEIVTGLTTQDSISHITHILGGLCGGVFGFLYRDKRAP